MPVVTVQGPPHPQIATLLVAVADAIAEALALGPGDVIATYVTSDVTVQNGAAGAAPPWIVVTVQGSARERSSMEAARSSAEAAARAWTSERGVAIGGVWTQWLVPMPIAP